jgi:hypothetical protein
VVGKVASVSGQEKAEPLPIPLDKGGFEYAVKTWALKVKSASNNANLKKYTFVVEFTKDLKPEELTSLIEAFSPSNGSSRLVFYFLTRTTRLSTNGGISERRVS